MFDDLFPRSAFHFDTSALSGAEWLEGLGGDEADLRWSIALLSDELLRSCASYHGEGDYFVSPRFLSKRALLRREISMATKRKVRDAVRQEDKAEWVGFLDYRLDDEGLAALDEWKPKPQDIWAEVDALISSGYRLTLSYNAKTHLASCTLICDDANKAWGGYALSSSDEDGALALKMAVFKHLRLERSWQALLNQPVRRGQRG
jgi:hypothetical protein